ncbi:MAG: hypothetical protein H6Q37_1587 [Chloroflexi bacterium]|jgi:hypothetical protein|nr:hypothetical protein [Chloroflexota bacterium]
MRSEPEHNTSDLIVETEPWGPDPAALEAVSCALLEHPRLQEYLADTRHRLLAFDLIDREQKTTTPRPPGRYHATIYDYTNNRTLFAEGCLDEPDLVVVTESAAQPLPSDEEFDAAVNLLLEDPDLGPRLRQQQLQVYRPMPPLIEVEAPDGRIERTLAVGLFSDDLGHQIVAVNLINNSVLHDLHDIPLPNGDVCGPPAAGGCADSGPTQQLRLKVTQGSNVLWTFTVVRPSASSGTNGSGIELRYVNYRGKQVLYRAHVPILNIEYSTAGVQAGCGPTYRDWQNQENCFEAVGSDFAPGFRLCTAPPKTILDSNSDAGNFHGVAIYVAGQEVVLVSEMAAGWYRYISEWRLHTNGTIRPRFGFAAVNNPCTCKSHHHHAYWRFDFDIRTAGRNLVEEYNNPPLFTGMNWHRKIYEIRRPRDSQRKRKWRISNTSTGEGYELIPGANDGAADSYGVGDVWVLRYHATEIDDGQGFTTDPTKSKAQLDRFINGELVENQDVVVWYAGHFLHDAQHAGSHIIGPELKPVNW